MEKYKSLLIIIPIICALLALNGFGIFFRVGVTASSIAILLILSNIKEKKEIRVFIAALFFSIIGDWFLGHRNGFFCPFYLWYYFLFHRSCRISLVLTKKRKDQYVCTVRGISGIFFSLLLGDLS